MQEPHRRCIALLGVTRNTDNYGVRVLLSSAIEVLSVAEPESDIILLDYGRKPEEWIERTSGGGREIRLVNLRFSWRLHLSNNIFRLIALAALSRAIPHNGWRLRLLRRNPWLRAVLRQGANYSIAGGDSFSDIYGLQRFLYVALPQLLVLLVGRPLIMLPQTYGPFNGRLARFLASWILRRAQVVLSRDEDGVGTIRALTGKDMPIVQVVPDLGFCMVPEPVDDTVLSQIDELRRRGPIVGLNVSSLLYMGGYTGDNMFRLREPFPVLVNELIKHIVRELGAQILLVPHVCGGPLSQEDETRLCKQIQAEFCHKYGDRIHYLNREFNHQKMKTLIGRCDIFIGSRMHACIGAVSQGVPTVCLAYSSKFAGVMKALSDGANVIDLRAVTIQETFKAVEEVFREREHLQRKLHAKMSPVRESVLNFFIRFSRKTEEQDRGNL